MLERTSTPIQVLPRGLTAFLQIKAGGFNPSYMRDELLPTLDLVQWYLEENAEHLGEAALAVAAVGVTEFTTLAVPAGEYWAVEEFCVSCGLGAGATAKLASSMIMETGGPSLNVGPVEVGIATENVRTRMDRIRFVGPGARFFVHCQSVTGGPISVSGNLRITRFRPA